MARHKDKRAVVFRTVILFVIIFIVGAFAVIRMTENGGDSDLRQTLAQCLTDNNAVIYNAYWCPHCANQERRFGNAWDTVTQVECAVPGNPRVMSDACKDAGIEGYPTWVFSDGTRLDGDQELSELAEVAGCPWGEETVEEEATEERVSPAPTAGEDDVDEEGDEPVVDPLQTL